MEDNKKIMGGPVAPGTHLIIGGKDGLVETFIPLKAGVVIHVTQYPGLSPDEIARRVVVKINKRMRP